MSFNRKVWEQVMISERNLTGWICGECFVGALSSKGISKGTRLNIGALRLSCTNESCNAEYFVHGDVKYYDSRHQECSKEYYKSKYVKLLPTHFQPTLNLFSLNRTIPAEIADLIKLSFSHFWSDLDACSNKVRQSLEAIAVNQSWEGPTLDKQIKNSPLEPPLKEALLALKWIGNEGSHPGGNFQRSQILDMYEILDLVLKEIYPDNETEERLSGLVNRINQNKGIKGGE